ncbi:MAG: IS1380 family transposase [Cyanothece sp. SIO2G6]|nr:IS1380 family transposase [Cyanothece sp. SIO2G6]
MTVCDSELALNVDLPRPLVVQFSALELSADAGVLLAHQAEQAIGICEGIAGCIPEWRDPSRLVHSLPQLVSQRIYQLVGGYEDADDCDALRHDPIFKVVCGRLPLPSANELASQPTMSRLENQVKATDIKAIRRLFIDGFIASHEVPPRAVVLDIDGWADPTHGDQEQSAFHGYYGHHMYYPVLINEATRRFPLVLHLRPGNSHPGKGVAAILRWVFWRLRRAWPGVSIILRGDCGFSLPEILTVCERAGVGFALGFASNAVLKRKIDYLLDQARVQYHRTGEKARLFDDRYYAAGSWDEPHRLIMKAEWLPKGPNPRFVVTNLAGEAQAIYDQFYVQRGEASEHPIKELKLGLRADRLSCHHFVANQFRLLLVQAAYLLLITLRHAAEGTDLATAQVDRLRSSVIKVAARVKTSTRRVLVELAAFCPFAQEMKQIAHRLSAPKFWLYPA